LETSKFIFEKQIISEVILVKLNPTAIKEVLHGILA